MERDKAIAKVLYVLRNQLTLLSRPDREDALQLARKHSITAEDLLEAAVKRARST